MKGILRFLSKEYVIVGILTVVILMLSLLPMYLKLLDGPAGRGFIPVHNSLSDYPFYTSIIAQGLDGQDLVWGRFTSEPKTGGARVHYLYLIFGRIARIFGVTDAHVVYHAVRLILAGVFIVAVYIFVSMFARGKTARLAAFFLALFSAGWPVLTDYQGQPVWWWPMNWWTELDPIQRATFLPHYLTGHLLLLTSMILVIRMRRSSLRIYPAILSAATFLAAYIHPPSMIMPLMAAPLFYLLTKSYRSILRLLPAYLTAVLGVFLVRQEFTVFPWNLWLDFERMSFALSTWEYILALGPVLPLGLAGFYLLRKQPIYILMTIWVTLSVVMIEIIRWFPTSPLSILRELTIGNIRFLQMVVWVPLAVGAGNALSVFAGKFGRKKFAVVMAVLAAVTFLGYPQSVRFQREKIYGAPEFTYPSGGFMDAILALRDLVKPDEVIWALPLAGQIIPSYTNRTVYTGNQVYYTVDLKGKTDTAYGLYHGNLDLCTIYKEMKNQRIKAIFYGFDEQNAAGDATGEGQRLKTIPFLMPWKQFGDTSIFLFVDARPEGCN